MTGDQLENLQVKLALRLQQCLWNYLSLLFGPKKILQSVHLLVNEPEEQI